MEFTELNKIKGKYVVKPCQETWLSHNIDKNHEGAVMFGDAFDSFVVGMKYPSGILNTGVSDTQAREFEAAMNLKAGSLNVYNKEFWANFRFPINRDGLVLDCDNNIMDKLRFVTLTADPKTVKSKAEVEFTPGARWLISSEERELEDKGKDLDVKKKAYAIYLKMSDNQMTDFLKVFEDGKYRAGKTTPKDQISTKVNQIVEEKPFKFIDLMNNPDFKDLVFLEDLLRARILKTVGVKVMTQENDLIGENKYEAMVNLRSPEYQDVKISLKSKLEVINK
jgi:hypothetical protein